MMKIFRRLFHSSQSAPDPEDTFLEMAPHGRILVLDLTPIHTRQRGRDFDRLMKHMDGPTPFVGILIDLTGVDYRLSSADLASILNDWGVAQGMGRAVCHRHDG
jgi:hypothetical protein